MTYDHISHLRQVINDDVRSAQIHRPITWADLQTQWGVIERECELRGYDIFAVYGVAAHVISTISAFRQDLLSLALQMELGVSQMTATVRDAIGLADYEQLVRKDREYGSSWKRRGGVGAFMMTCRKWDRLEQQISGHESILVAGMRDERPEGIRDDIGDLRRYFQLIEAEMRAWRAGSILA